MAEAIGLTSGIITLTIFVKSLHKEVSSFKSQRQSIKDVQADLGSLVTLLTSIHEQAQCPQEIERFKPLQTPLECCRATCKEMYQMLEACTKHSQRDRNSVRDWLKMRYHERSFEDMKQRLASYKSTLGITFELIKLRDHSYTQDSIDELKDSISGVKEDLEDQLDQVQEAISTSDASSREILMADQAQLRSSLESIAEAQRAIDSTPHKVVIKGNKVSQGGRAIFGTDMSHPELSLNVSDNDAGPWAVMGAGMYSTETLQALLKNSRTPELAETLQALQTQAGNASTAALQSILQNMPVKGNQGLADSPPAMSFPMAPVHKPRVNMTAPLDNSDMFREAIHNQ